MADLAVIPALPGFESDTEAAVFLTSSNPGMGEYSGDVLKSRKPEVYRAAVQLLGRGYGIRDTAAILGISARSVMAIRDREPTAIATVKEQTAKRYMDVSQLAAEIARERLVDAPDSVSFKDLMIGGAVATDKALVLSGEATQRIEHVVRPADDDFTRMMQDARARGQVIEGEVVPDTGIDGRRARTNAAPALPALVPAPVPGADASDQPAGLTPDMESDVYAANPPPLQGYAPPATGTDTGAAAGAAAALAPADQCTEARATDPDRGDERGGEGVRPSAEPLTSNESASAEF
jgi:hypothetical protein